MKNMTNQEKFNYFIKDIIIQSPNYDRIRDFLFSKYYEKMGNYSNYFNTSDNSYDFGEFNTILEPIESFNLLCGNLDDKSSVVKFYCVLFMILLILVMLGVILFGLRTLIKLLEKYIDVTNGESTNRSNNASEYTNEKVFSGHIPMRSITVENKKIPICSNC